MIVSSVSDLLSCSLFYQLEDLITVPVYLKIEGLNIANSIKLKTSKHMLEVHEKKQNIVKGKTKIICSTSGNLGIALSIICKAKGYDLICVVDLNTNLAAVDLIKLYGAKVIIVQEKDINGGFLGTRIKLIHKMMDQDKTFFWINQYEDQENAVAHYKTTAQEIYDEISDVAYLFVGAGTTGTLMGCARFFKEYSPETRIVAVDSKGSVTFSQSPKRRYIPGLGTSHRPGIVNERYIDDIVWVDDQSTAEMCHYIFDRYGLCIGGSTGSVLSAIYNKYKNICGKVVAISPDLGHSYLKSIYSLEWLEERGIFLPHSGKCNLRA